MRNTPPSTGREAPTRGFTLIELLVVIAIISLLAAILFPVFARAKASAKKTACLSNLHQIGQGIVLYMNDYDDVFPHALDASDKWATQIWDPEPEYKAQIPNMPLLNEVLQPYIKSKDVFHCPSDTGTEVLDDHFPQVFQTAPTLWTVYNSSYFFRTEIAFKANVSLPADINVLFDGAGNWHGSGRAARADDDFGTFLALTHGYRYNTLYGDMHAKSITYGGLMAAWNTNL